MTLSSTLEAKLRDRGSSSPPADAAGKVLGVQPRNEDGAARFATIVHWGYAVLDWPPDGSDHGNVVI